MKLFGKGLVAGALVLGLSGLAQAGTIHVGPIRKANDEYVACVASNVGKSPATVTMEVLDHSASSLTTHSTTLRAGFTESITTLAPSAAICKFTTSGSTKSLLTSAILREIGGDEATRAVIQGPMR